MGIQLSTKMMKIPSLHFFLLSAFYSTTYTTIFAEPIKKHEETDVDEEVSTSISMKSVETCFDYSEILDIGTKDCTWHYLFEHIRDVYTEQDQLEETPKCDGGLTAELRKLTNTVDTTGAEWKYALEKLCEEALTSEDALDDVEIVDWTPIEDAAVDLEEFFNGGGFLNNEVGNLQQEEEEFIKRGGYDRYHYIGTDPSKNDYLPTSQKSVDGGNVIVQFYNEDITNKFLSPPSFSKLEKDSSCELTNAAVCCWSRDRQYNDNNGSCNSNGHCRDGNPGDNTDLCWTTKGEDEVFPYPNGQTEGSLHCHGYSWSNNDIISSDKTKYNNLFYVSLYDHLYKRGYVQSITDNELQSIQGDDQPMCGCVEDMHPIARADCTEIVPRVNYTSYQDDDTGFLVVEPQMETFSLEYKACEGYEYDPEVTPETFTENGNSGLRRRNNDLSAYVYRQYLEGNKEFDQTVAFEETIIGYKDPDVNRGDTDREAACKAAFEQRYPGVEWIEREKEHEEQDEE